MSIGMQANKAKIGVLLTYISSNIPNLNLRKLIKLVFLIDERYVKENGYPLTWLDYYAWRKGPVAPEIYSIKDGLFSEYVKAVKNTKDGKYYISPVSSIDMEKELELFGEYHLEVINFIINKYKNYSDEQLSDATHSKDSIWTKTGNENKLEFNETGKTEIKLDLTSLIKDDNEKYNAYFDALDNIQFTATLNNA